MGLEPRAAGSGLLSSHDHLRSEEAQINPVVFTGSLVVLMALAVSMLIYTDAANAVMATVLDWVSNVFGRFYFLAVLLYLTFVVGLALSPHGRIRLGPDDAVPEFNLLSWAAMLFAAGIGIDLLFFCVAEPVTHLLAPPLGDPATAEAARQAMALTFLHWGLSGWGVYTLVAVSIAYASYRRGLPLSIRSALQPLLGRYTHGALGDAVDIAAVIGTVFGIAASLGIGIIQLNFGLEHMFGIAQGMPTQVVLAVLIIVFAAVSAVTGIDRGIRRLSELNMLLALMLMLFVLFAGPTLPLLAAALRNAGDYLVGFPLLATNTHAEDLPRGWLNAWTVFFWAWWIAWGPFVGLFLARISRGRTIRELILGSLLLPLTFMMLWMAIMGNSAMDMVLADTGVEGFGEQVMAEPGSAIYLFLQGLPWSGVTTLVVTVLAIVFFVTSGDSGSLVLANLTSNLRDPNRDAPASMRILWAGVIGVLTLALLLANGLDALRSAVVIMGLPFAFVLLLMMAALGRALLLHRRAS